MLTLIIFLFGALKAQAQYQWQYLGNYDGIYSVYDANHFCIKDGAFAKFSQDGGNTFTNLGLPAASLLAVQYLSSNELMALTSAGGSLELFQSTDGGTTFISKGTVLDAAVYLGLSNREFFFLDANTGFIFQQVMYQSNLLNMLFKTSDGGQNWNLVEGSTAFDVSDNMFFDKDGNIFAAGSIAGQGLYLSQDTGATFTKLGGVVPVLNAGMNLAYDGQQSFFVNDIPGSNNSCCYVSSDGGASFSAWNTTGGSDLAFNRPQQVLIFGSNDTTALSVDNGQTFNTVRFGADKPSGSVYFINAADDGQAFYLNDGSAKLWVVSASTIGLEEDLKQVETSLYPNPAWESISLDFAQNPAGRLEVAVLALNGQVLMRQKLQHGERKVALGSLPAGCYFLTVQGKHLPRSIVPFVKQ